MIGLDSNVLVRYLTQDDAVQSKKADRLIDRAVQSGEPLFLNHVVLCEVSWVLSAAYGYSGAELGDALEKILSAAQFEFEQKDALWQALAAFRESGADFADCLIGVKNASAGCKSTMTFDKRAARLPQFALS